MPGQHFRLRRCTQVGLYFELHFHRLTNIETFPLGNNIDASAPPFSVLDAHHKKNRKVHAPNLRDLEHSGHYRPSNRRRKPWERKVPPMQTRLESDCEAEDEAPGGESDSSDDDTAKKRAPRNSNDKEPPKPTQMSYYDPPWTDVLEDAKNEHRLHIHTRVGFQKRTEAALEDAWGCVLEAITKYNDDPNNTVPLDESNQYILSYMEC